MRSFQHGEVLDLRPREPFMQWAVDALFRYGLALTIGVGIGFVACLLLLVSTFGN